MIRRVAASATLAGLAMLAPAPASALICDGGVHTCPDHYSRIVRDQIPNLITIGPLPVQPVCVPATGTFSQTCIL